MTNDELLAQINRAEAEGWTALDLSGQALRCLPPEIGNLTQLETLILGKAEEWKWVDTHRVPVVIGNEIETLPPELLQLTQLKILNLSGNPLKALPDTLAHMPQLSELTAIQTGLTEIPEFLGQLSNLRLLDLSNNKIKAIPAVIAQLVNLTALALCNNKLRKIPAFIGQLTQLIRLELSNNQLRKLPETIAQLIHLKELTLSNNQFKEIPSTLGQLFNLSNLYASNNRIAAIPPSIGELSNLTELALSNNHIECIPQEIGKLSRLNSLYLYNNKIRAIPAQIGQLTQLTKLTLSSNQIDVIPDEIQNLSQLNILALANNRITAIPEAIGRLDNLAKLYLSNNEIEEIPTALSHLRQLTELHLYRNQIKEIPAALSQLGQLRQLYLHANQIEEIPEVLSQLTNLSVLALSENRIENVPEAIGSLFNLQTLALNHNRLTAIPDTIGQLTNLTESYLSNNQIRAIPDAVGRLTKLSRLDLENNSIEEVPMWLQKLPNLKKLDLRRNALSISPEVLGPADIQQDPSPPKKIFSYLHELFSGERRQLNEAKLLIIGDGGVGKTSLIKRLRYNTYTPNESQTDGLNILNWPLSVNDQQVRLNVWDFGGQEIYHATHQFFFTKRSLYILACNCRTHEDETKIEYWLKLIQSFGGDSPVIIVGNKCDEQPLDINRKALRTKHPNIEAILETSCASGDGIEALREAIVQAVAQLNDVYNLLPLPWFQVKEALEDTDKDFITYTGYTNLCCENNVTNEESQEQLIDLLHNLGLVLNFREHSILRDTNVLNPTWVTTGVYALLSDETLKTQSKGILTNADLSRVLDPQKYPPKRYPYLTELIETFQLGFPISSCGPKRFLIPGLLPKEEPDEATLDGDTLEFQYHYDILPESIISRFIVLVHRDIHKHIYWRSGVILHHTEGDEIYNIACVKADPEDKKIFIAVSGKKSTRRTCLTLIRKTFERIHSSFSHLQVTEWVPVPGHPENPPLDYQELLGLEKMGEQTYPIGKLGIRVNIRQLLDGYEHIEDRQKRNRDELGEGIIPEKFRGNVTINKIYNNNQPVQGDQKSVSNTINQYGKGDNIAGDKVLGDKIHTQVNNSPDLVQATRDIKALFAEFEKEHDKTTPAGQAMISAKTLETIESKPTLKKRIVKAIKEGGAAAIEVAVDHPATKPLLAAAKGFMAD